jgi:hypothetical protein
LEKFGRGIENRCRQRTLPAGKPVAGCLRACGESRRFSDTEQNARTKDAAEPVCKGRHGRKKRPEKRAHAVDVGDAEAIEDHAGRNLQQRVGPEETTEEPTEFTVGQTEIVF